MVQLDDVTDLMDRMMQVEIIPPSQKERLLKDNEKKLLDPNLIMDARHKIFKENISASSAKSSALAEAKRLLTREESAELYLKKEQDLLERELKKFEKELHRSRPKFRGPYTCGKKNFVHSDDEDFWRTSKSIKDKVGAEIKRVRNDRNIFSAIQDETTFQQTIHGQITRKHIHGENVTTVRKTNDRTAIKQSSLQESDPPCIGSIKVTIKGKTNFESEKKHLHLLRKSFDALRENAAEQRRLREIKLKIQRNSCSRLTRKYFDIWRNYAEESKIAAQKREKQVDENTEEKKIEMFIDAITERQKELMKDRKLKPVECNSIAGNSSSVEIRKRNIYSKHIIVESPAQSRLNAQKRIIEKQREKLAEQNRIIEELRLEQVRQEISRSGRDTVNVAKETLRHCGERTRRTLVQLMRQAGYRDGSLRVSERAPSPPKFLARMEARARARKERIKLAEEERRKKLEEQKRKEEAAKIEEEQEKRRLQQEATREARRIRKEQEEYRLREVERSKKFNKTADEFYRKYLQRRYLLEPLMTLVELKKRLIEKANDYYKKNITRKVFVAWKTEMEYQCNIRNELATSFYNKRLMSIVFETWKQMAREESLKCQVAKDFCDMKLLDKCFKSWHTKTLEFKAQYTKNVELAESHYEKKLKSRYLSRWKKYPEIAAELKESEKRKNELRQIVQIVIPDFDPKLRGVAIED